MLHGRSADSKLARFLIRDAVGAEGREKILIELHGSETD